MSNYPPNARGDGLGSGGGIAEAYPSSTADRSEEAEYAYHSSDQNNMMHVYRQPLDRSNISSNDDGGGGGGGSGMSRRGSEVSRASFTSSSSQQQQQQQQQHYAPGERSVAAASSYYAETNHDQNHNQNDASEDGGSEHPFLRQSNTSRQRSVYEEAQLRSSFRTGGIMYNESVASHSMRSMRSSSRQQHPTMSSHNGSGGVVRGDAGGNSSGGVHSSLRSSGITNPGDASAGPSYINPHPRHRPVGVSLSGNLLVHVDIEEDADLELDKDEMRKLARAAKDEEDAAIATEAQYQLLNDTSTIGTTRSTRSRLSKSSSEVVVDGTPEDSYDIVSGPQSDVDRERIKMNEMIFSPPFRRTLFLGVCFVLMGLGVLLTLENFMSVKTARDWVEPHRDRYQMVHGGGIDWSFGSDAPKPIAGAYIDGIVESRLADWHHATSRVPAAAGMDGFGSVAVSETAMFNDVPIFWGLPFSGGTIMESVLGRCLKLVQASDKGMRDGDAREELHLRTVFANGSTYLNVDLSNQEGIARASALALGTSGMADVAHSSLLYEVSELFSPTNQGRLFVMSRHPVEREFARFRYMRRWNEGKLLGDHNKGMTYTDFAHSEYVADNWMTRTLVRKKEDEELTAQDMHVAKEILRRKALVGLYSDIMGATRHYARHFGWDHARNGGKLNRGALSCFERAILDGMEKDLEQAGYLVEKDTREGSVAWGKIMSKNKFDFELYIYSQQLYKFQISLS